MYTQLEKQLEEYHNIVFYKGLSEEAITTIEKDINKRFPFYFREFLKTFGVMQDFVFGLMTSKDRFYSQNDLPKEIQQSYILIGDNGGEDYWLLNTEDESDTNIYDWESWNTGEIKKLSFDFTTLLKDSISKLSDSSTYRIANEDKYWSVQFSISTNDANDIFLAILIKMVGDWISIDVSSAEVYSSEMSYAHHRKSNNRTYQKGNSRLIVQLFHRCAKRGINYHKRNSSVGKRISLIRNIIVARYGKEKQIEPNR